jgi:hypothetical protein
MGEVDAELFTSSDITFDDDKTTKRIYEHNTTISMTE